jgi:hypothetical protein
VIYHFSPRKLITFQVDNPGNDIHTQGEAFSAIPIGSCKNFEHFYLGVDVFNANSFSRNATNATVFCFFVLCQLPVFRIFLWVLRIFVKSEYCCGVLRPSQKRALRPAMGCGIRSQSMLHLLLEQGGAVGQLFFKFGGGEVFRWVPRETLPLAAAVLSFKAVGAGLQFSM